MICVLLFVCKNSVLVMKPTHLFSGNFQIYTLGLGDTCSKQYYIANVMKETNSRFVLFSNFLIILEFKTI